MLETIAAGGHIWSSYDYAFVYDHNGFGKRTNKSTLHALVRRGWVSEVERTHPGSLGRVRYVISPAGEAALKV